MVNNQRVAQNVSVDVFEVSEVLPVLNESKHFIGFNICHVNMKMFCYLQYSFPLILGIFKEEEN